MTILLLAIFNLNFTNQLICDICYYIAQDKEQKEARQSRCCGVVYQLKIFSVNPKNNTYIYSMKYMINDYNFNYFKADYIYHINSEIVLISNPKKYNLSSILNLKLKKFDKTDSLEVLEKLGPLNSSFTSSGFLRINKNGKKSEAFFKRSENLPKDYQVDDAFTANGYFFINGVLQSKPTIRKTRDE